MNFLHRKKKLAAVLVAACIAAFSATAFAEQPKAEEYRALFASGNFCVKYGVGHLAEWGFDTIGADYRQTAKIDKYKPSPMYIVVAGEQGTRMKGIFGNKGRTIGLNGEFLELHKRKTAPDALYKDGKYYRINSEKNTDFGGFLVFTWSKTTVKSTALMLSENSLNSPTLDAREGWGHIRKDLALPDELAVFRWNDSYRDEAGHSEAPHFIGSSKHMVNEKMYDCDEYAVDKKTMSGAILSQDIWRTFYENGDLAYVQRLFVRDGKEELVSMIDIREISSNVPAELFELPKGTLVYAADEGKMYDLTEQGLLIEKIGEKPGDKKKASSTNMDDGE